MQASEYPSEQNDSIPRMVKFHLGARYAIGDWSSRLPSRNGTAEAPPWG